MVSQASALFPSGVLQFPGAEVYTLPLTGGEGKEVIPLKCLGLKVLHPMGEN